MNWTDSYLSNMQSNELKNGTNCVESYPVETFESRDLFTQRYTAGP